MGSVVRTIDWQCEQCGAKGNLPFPQSARSQADALNQMRKDHKAQSPTCAWFPSIIKMVRRDND